MGNSQDNVVTDAWDTGSTVRPKQGEKYFSFWDRKEDHSAEGYADKRRHTKAAGKDEA